MKKKLSKLLLSIFAVFTLALLLKVPTQAAVYFANLTDDAVTITWDKPNDVLKSWTLTGYVIYDGNQVVRYQTADANATSATVSNLGKGYSGTFWLYYTYKNSSGSIDSSYMGYVYVNTTPADMSKSSFGISYVSYSSNTVTISGNRPSDATGMQFELFKGSKSQGTKENSYSVDYNIKKNVVYKYRVRAYYTNSSNNQTYYGAWSSYRYFTSASISGNSKSNQKGATITLKKISGVKKYLIYATTTSGAKGKKIKTVTVTGKKKTIRLTKGLKKKKANYIRVIPVIKVGKKTVNSDVITTGSVYVWK